MSNVVVIVSTKDLHWLIICFNCVGAASLEDVPFRNKVP